MDDNTSQISQIHTDLIHNIQQCIDIINLQCFQCFLKVMQGYMDSSVFKITPMTKEPVFT